MTLQILKVSCKQQRKLLSSFLNLFGEKSFTYLFLLNLISNGAYAYTYHPFMALLLMVCLSGSMAFLETLLFSFLRRRRLLGRPYLIVIVTVYSLLILTDYFCIFNFQTTFNQDKLDILRETTSKETKEFLQTYISFGLLSAGVVGVFLLHGILLFLSFIIANKKIICRFFAILTVTGFIGWGFMVVSYAKFHNGFTIPQYTSVTRIAYSYHVSKQRLDEIKQLYTVCRHIPVSQTFRDRPNVIVLIGESASIYHSGVFGYKFNTTPNLKRMEAEGNLIAFDNAVSVDDHTHGAMDSVFSLDSLHTGFNKTPLFPAVYKNGKY